MDFGTRNRPDVEMEDMEEKPDTDPIDRVASLSLSRALWDMRLKGQLTDVVFIVEDREFPAHRAVLGGRSAVFRARVLENEERDPNGNTRISIETVSVPAFEVFLRYVYRGILNLSSLPLKDALDLADLMNTYKIAGAMKPCSEYFAALLDFDTCAPIYLTTKGIEDMHDLAEKAFDMMMTPEKFREILGNETLLELDGEALDRILKLDRLQIREVDILLALLRWGFQFVAIDEFCTSPITSRLLKHIRVSMLPRYDPDTSDFNPTAENFVFTEVNAMKFIKKFAMSGFNWLNTKQRSSTIVKSRHVLLYREVQVRHISSVASREEFRLRQAQTKDPLMKVVAVRLNTFHHACNNAKKPRLDKGVKRTGTPKLTLTFVQGEEVVGEAVVDVVNERNESHDVKLNPPLIIPFGEFAGYLKFNVKLTCDVHDSSETCFIVESGSHPLVKNQRIAVNESTGLFLDTVFPDVELNSSSDDEVHIPPNFIKSVNVEYDVEPEPCRTC